MRIATWNVNGIRARQGQLLEWLATERPDIVCLQEIKASLDQLPFELRDLEGYHAGWHGEKGYSGVALLVARSLVAAPPVFSHPPFDFEQRVISAELDFGQGPVLTSSFYVPNGGKDFAAKINLISKKIRNFVRAETAKGKTFYIAGASTRGNTLLQVCGLMDDIEYAVERNPTKVGKKWNNRTEVISEQAADELPPDYYLVLPWHFFGEFVVREYPHLKRGLKLLLLQ